MKKIFLISLIALLISACAKQELPDPEPLPPLTEGEEANIKLGLQSWSCRFMTFEEAVKFAATHGIRYVEFFSGHLNPSDPVEENLRKKAYLEKFGVVAYSIGVSGTSMDKEENRKLFELAKLFDMELVVVEPRDMNQWDNLEELVKEYDIKLAIHNHGTGTVYGDPATVRNVLKERDPRIGVCMDIGWITAAGHDPLETYKAYEGRVCDMHFKDKIVKVKDGKNTPVDALAGQGEAKFIPLFDEMKKSEWKGVLAIETDSKEFQEDPTELVTVAKEFFAEHIEAK